MRKRYVFEKCPPGERIPMTADGCYQRLLKPYVVGEYLLLGKHEWAKCVKVEDVEEEKVTASGAIDKRVKELDAIIRSYIQKVLPYTHDFQAGAPPQPAPLKPCPLCGDRTVNISKEKADEALGGFNYVFLCGADDCPFHFYFWDQDGLKSESEARAAWNRRTL